MIPKKIHYCWYGYGAYNNVLNNCLISWKEKLPGYEIKKWDETNTPFNKFPFLRLLYKQKKWSLISDYMRLFSVYTEGGIYLDTDIEVIKKFDDLLDSKGFIGFQTKEFNPKNPINSALIGAVKGNEFVLECIKKTEINHRTKLHSEAGPNIVSKVLISHGMNSYKMQEIQDIKIYPVEYFHPMHWTERIEDAHKFITEETYCIHLWQESWVNKKKNLKYFYISFSNKLQKTPLIIASRLKYLLNKKSFYDINKFLDIK